MRFVPWVPQSEKTPVRRKKRAPKPNENASRNDFTAIITHELKTPLTAIRAGVELLLDGIDGALNDAQRHTLTLTRKNIDRLTHRVLSALDHAKAKMGRFTLSPEAVNLNELILETVGFMQPSARKQKILLSHHLPKQAPIVECDPDRVRQVLLNLLDNAIKFTPEGGFIRVRLKSTGETVQIQVQDSGIGIKKKDQSRIFSIFEQARSQDSPPNAHGFGIGLSVCKTLIEQHRGRLLVNSTPGKGTTFTIELPR